MGLDLLLGQKPLERKQSPRGRGSAHVLKDPEAEVRVAAIHVLTAIRMASPVCIAQGTQEGGRGIRTAGRAEGSGRGHDAMLGDRDATVRGALPEPLASCCHRPGGRTSAVDHGIKDEDAGVAPRRPKPLAN